MTEIFRTSPTFRLFRKEPSFVRGVSSVIAIGGASEKYNVSTNESEADYRAIKNDWEAVGGDLKSALKEYEQKSSKPTSS